MRAVNGAAFATLCVLLLLIGCGGVETATLPSATTTTAAPRATGPYLGQSPPGVTPEVFASGIVSSPGFSEYSGTFSGDGNEYYFYRFSPSSENEILFSRLVDGGWSTPAPLPLTSGYGAGEPHVTLDGEHLYFMWDRPIPEGQSGGRDDFTYYVADRTVSGWSEPRYAGQGMFMSSTRDGQLYTTDMSEVSAGGKTYLAKLTIKDGVFTAYERLTIPAYLGSQAHPCIAPDGSYLLFDVDGGSHLFVCFKRPDGSWGDAVDLAQHGFDPYAGGAYVSPDGEYLFFALRDDIWWVDAKVIEDLRPKD